MLSVNYMRDLNKWAEEDYYMKNVHIFELPHILVSDNTIIVEFVIKVLHEK